MCHSSSAPASARIAIVPTANPRAASAQIITRRRSKRSLTTPPMSRNTIVGIVIAMPTMPSAVGSLDSV